MVAVMMFGREAGFCDARSLPTRVIYVRRVVPGLRQLDQSQPVGPTSTVLDLWFVPWWDRTETLLWVFFSGLSGEDVSK